MNKIIKLTESDLVRIVNRVLNEGSEVEPKFNASDLISMSQGILNNSGVKVNVQDYVNPGENPMCIPQSDKTGILSKVFDFLNGKETTDEIKKEIYTLSKGEFSGIKLNDDQKNEALIIAAGLIAADESEQKEESQISENFPVPKGYNYRAHKKRGRRAAKKKCPRRGK
jgi:hypothetical protein